MTKILFSDETKLVDEAAIATSANGVGPSSPREAIGDDADEALSRSEVVVVEGRQLVRDAVARGFAASLSWRVHGYPTIDHCLASANDWSRAVIVHLVLGDEGDALVANALEAMQKADCPASLMVLSDRDEAASVIEAFKKGAKGYLSMSVPVRVAAQAIRLVAAGGCYVPVSCLVSGQAVAELARTDGAPCPKIAEEGSCMFTARQTAVIEALRRGKANKIIAYELNMRESTVKVHVRNIMKKLNARNRTEVAYRANELLEFRR